MRRAFLITASLVTWSALWLQLWLVVTGFGPARGLTIAGSVLLFLSFMTVLTNIWVGLVLVLPIIAARSRLARWMAHPSVQGALLVYILAVGVVYHVLLSDEWDPQGPARLADALLHTAVPLIYLVHWWLFSTKGALHVRSIPRWLLYPLIYVVLAMIYGRITGRYPYPFLDLPHVGWTALLTTCSLILLGYALLALAVVGADQFFARRDRA